MKRFVPRSLAGQMALLLGIALLIAQLANFALILNERQKLSLAQNEGPAITRFASVAADVIQASPEFRSAVVSDASRRGARFTLGSQTNAGTTRDGDVEERLTSALADTGVRLSRVEASRVAGDVQGSSFSDRQSLRLSADLGSAGWLNGQIVTPRRDPLLPARLALATALLFALVLGATLWMASRIARPLRALTTAADLFGGKTQPVSVGSSGPADLRKAIDAFNAMNARVVSLLDDKDRTLGAIGHDLRTPLTSLRIRLESMDPPEETGRRHRQDRGDDRDYRRHFAAGANRPGSWRAGARRLVRDGERHCGRGPVERGSCHRRSVRSLYRLCRSGVDAPCRSQPRR